MLSPMKIDCNKILIQQKIPRDLIEIINEYTMHYLINFSLVKDLAKIKNDLNDLIYYIYNNIHLEKVSVTNKKRRRNKCKFFSSRKHCICKNTNQQCPFKRPSQYKKYEHKNKSNIINYHYYHPCYHNDDFIHDYSISHPPLLLIELNKILKYSKNKNEDFNGYLENVYIQFDYPINILNNSRYDLYNRKGQDHFLISLEFSQHINLNSYISLKTFVDSLFKCKYNKCDNYFERYIKCELSLTTNNNYNLQLLFI